MKASIEKIGAFFLFLGILFCIVPTRAQDVSCEALSPLQLARIQKPSQTSTIIEWARYQQRIFEAKKLVALAIFNSYMSGSFDDNFFETCLSSTQDYDDLQEILPSIFLEESLKRLAASHSPSIIKFSEMIASRIKNNNFVLFRLAGHFKADPAPTNLAGGFHRGHGSIFMNFVKIPPNEWLMILTHELLHSLDTGLANAISEYSKNATVLQMVKDNKTLEQLSPPEKMELQRWVMAGLDRGFLAEYRAWTATFKIYQDGLSEGLWKPIDWLDSILAAKTSSEDLEAFAFKYLDPRFTDPPEWPFRSSPVNEELEHIRRQMRENGANVNLSNLKNLID